MIVPPDVRDDAINAVSEAQHSPKTDPITPLQLVLIIAITLAFCFLPLFWEKIVAGLQSLPH